MKICSCYIRAFGQIEEKSYEFDDGLNPCIYDNGGGKTTFLAFVKAMFYGLSDKRTRMTDRVNYLPWSGAYCGGNMVIDVDGTRYRIERGFGVKPSEDTFTLYHQDTGKISDDYGEDIGERLFGVDKESFEKSVFFGQGKLKTQSTDSLNAKIGNLTDVRDDINRFDAAIKKIEDATKLYNKRGSKNPGKITELQEKIRECRESGEKIPIVLNAIEERKRSIYIKQSQIEDLSKSSDELTRQIKELAENIEKEGRKKAVKDQLSALGREISQLEHFFENNIPLQEDIVSMQNKLTDLRSLQTKLTQAQERLPDEEKMSFLRGVFGEDEPATKALLDQAREDAKVIGAMRLSGQNNIFSEENEKAMADYSVMFERGLPQSEDIKKLIESAKEVEESKLRIKVSWEHLNRLKEEYLVRKRENDHIFNPTHITGIITGLLLFFGGIFATAILDGQSTLHIVSMIGIGIGAVMLLIFGISSFTGNMKKNKALAQMVESISQEENALGQMREITDKNFSAICDYLNNYSIETDDLIGSLVKLQTDAEDYKRLCTQYENYKKDIADSVDVLAEAQMDLYVKLAPYAEKYGYDLYEDHSENQLLDAMREDIVIYDEYIANLNEISTLKLDIGFIEKDINDFLQGFKWEEDLQEEQKLMTVKTKTDSLVEKKKLAETLEEELKGYESINEDINDESTESIEQKQEALNEIQERQKTLIAEKAKEEEDLSSMRNDVEILEEEARILPALEEEMCVMEKKVEIYDMTKEYLIRAKDNFLSRYMRPLREGMEKYVNRFLPENMTDGLEVGIDMELSVCVSYKGKSYSEEYLSQGYKDFANICARLSLIDVLYKKEKPPLFFDDPFVNLDETKIAAAMKMVEDISDSTQVMYMTCHASRLPDKAV